jgi:VWFA-related protein
MTARAVKQSRRMDFTRLWILVAFILAWPPAASQAQTTPSNAPQPPAATSAGQPAAEQTSPAQPGAPASDTPEVNTQESAVPFRVRVNLVPIRVVVHDVKGRPVTNLRREDFKIFQDGKPQVLSNFSVETPGVPAGHAEAAVEKPDAGAEALGEKHTAIQLPTRFVALLFDDVHIQFGDLARVRNAADRYVENSLQPTDRVAVFTFSGQSQQDFTDDRAKLHTALLRLRPTAVSTGSTSGAGECPPMDYYEADLIANKTDPSAIAVATADVVACGVQSTDASQLVQVAAMRALDAGDVETQYSFRGLQDVVRRITALPGQRSIVLISPGFIFPRREDEFWEIVDRATRSNVFINTLDARGLWVLPPGGDISQPKVGDPRVDGPREMMLTSAQSAQSEVLISLAANTGGFDFRNNNDFDAGLRTVAAMPEASYVLGFTPQGLKFDGRFHSLKVTLVPKGNYTVQARRGFFAPKHDETPEEAAKQEIEDALFSQEVQHGIPIALHTQYYMVDRSKGKLSVLTHVDVGHMRFAKAGDRNQNDLTVVAALFDQNGNFMSGMEKTVHMALRDATLQRLNRTGITVTTDFDVKPGAYVVRLVVRDAQAANLSAENGVVEIPY